MISILINKDKHHHIVIEYYLKAATITK